MIRIACMLAISLVLASPACADWQYVKWGMSKSAAVAASKREAKVTTGDPNVGCAFEGQKPFATIPRKAIGGFDFQVTLCTDGSDKVTSVALRPADGTNLPTLRRALVSQYGQPARAAGTDIWNDRKSGNTVSYWEISDVIGCIEYKKMAGAGL